VSGWERVIGTPSVNNDNNKTVTVNCPGTKKVIGGGGSINNDSAFITQSYPSADNQWTVRSAKVNGSVSWIVTAYAICANVQ
jgi:hypothetical protein